MIVRRHPVLGVLGGALIGVGLALLFAMFGVAPIGRVLLSGDGAGTAPASRV